MKVSALIPAKGFTNAKHRLAPLLGAEERELLAEAMLRDVLRQVVSTRGLEGTFVVTGDSRVSEIASSLGAKVIWEKQERGETEAVVFALRELKQRGIQSVLIMPGDIPLVRSSDIELLLEQIAGHDSTAPFALLTPSHDRMGTNALLLSPPDLIKLRFGYDSFSYHLGEVAAKGLPLRVLGDERIALDIDEPQDLERFVEFVARDRGLCSPNKHDNRARLGGSETYSRLLKMEMVERL
ncbi:MAG: 2-phospho-L-lactate guanylyltransferase [Candidatus Binatia bacterium]